MTLGVTIATAATALSKFINLRMNIINMGSLFGSETRKAQISPITMVILAGMGLLLATAAYMWGMPLIEKGATMNDYTEALNFIKNLDSKIVSIANAQSGEESINIPNGLMTIIPYDADDPDSNTIILEFITPQPLVADGSVYVDTNILGEVAEYGEAEPRTILLNGKWLETRRNILTFKLHYRELDTETTPPKGYKIMLNNLTESGTNRIIISFDNTRPENPERIPGAAANQGELIATYINILLE